MSTKRIPDVRRNYPCVSAELVREAAKLPAAKKPTS